MLVGLVVVLGSGLTWPAGSAWADDPSAVDQYREDIPTSAGSTHTGSSGGGSSSLPSSVVKQVNQQGGSDAATITKVATSSAYGAPQKRLRGTPHKRLRKAEPTHARPPQGSAAAGTPDRPSAVDALSSAAGELTGGGRWRVNGLLIALVFITGAVLGAAARRQRQHRA